MAEKLGNDDSRSTIGQSPVYAFVCMNVCVCVRVEGDRGWGGRVCIIRRRGLFQR